jgi:hypothetical protein
MTEDELILLQNRYEASQRMAGAIYQTTLDVAEGDEREALQYIHGAAGMILDLDLDPMPETGLDQLRLF